MNKTTQKVDTYDRKKRAVMAYLNGMGYSGGFEDAVQQWMAQSPKDVIAAHKIVRRDGSMNINGAVNAVFEEIDNVDLDRSPKLATAVQNAYRIYRGKTSQIGDESGMYEPVTVENP